MSESTTLDSTRFAALQQIPLWDFALAFYARPGVEQACLTLQDEAAVDVCELLFHGWLFAHGLDAMPQPLSALRRERQEWQAGVTDVLRTLRRNLKHTDSPSETITTLRERVKQAELLAERENLQRWQTWAWDADQPFMRLRNMPKTPHDTGRWLQKRLLLPHNLVLRGFEPKAEQTLQRAFSVLGQQLDPLQRAR
ncbi:MULTISPECIES: TIGR02444 family protein [unclassified Halomonas]|uniref:TIGR02444 family protein n=1 Tax=unclassified Halomonas TaxID=2609666 RepID=UPI0006DA7491|nr:MULTISPECIES: TIGR02444 family protein [unclassified Halomonas]KPQ30960.1 MAG: TIGR02444 family protein [Halomonas sp. HL-93]SBR45012.1 TIGR02444 family protein [Halomonas sp. HL-93]SNY97754.1 TIGR02444 family protein [Halomonas sp. hl-4]